MFWLLCVDNCVYFGGFGNNNFMVCMLVFRVDDLKILVDNLLFKGYGFI